MTAVDDKRLVAERDADDGADGVVDRVRTSQVGRSIWRTPRPVTRRDQAASHWSSFFLHIYPVKVRRKEIGFAFSWYLGVMSTVLLGSLVVSGIYLMFFYVPSPASAYTNIQTLQTEVAFGQYVRNIHRWSAHLMVLAVAAHMGRVFYRGAYKATPGVQLGHRCGTPHPHAAHELHRLSAAMGSTGVLGGHGWHRNGGLRAVLRRRGQRAAARRAHRWFGHVAPVLRAPRSCSSQHDRRAADDPPLALAQRRHARNRSGRAQ